MSTPKKPKLLVKGQVGAVRQGLTGFEGSGAGNTTKEMGLASPCPLGHVEAEIDLRAA